MYPFDLLLQKVVSIDVTSLLIALAGVLGTALGAAFTGWFKRDISREEQTAITQQRIIEELNAQLNYERQRKEVFKERLTRCAKAYHEETDDVEFFSDL